MKKNLLIALMTLILVVPGTSACSSDNHENEPEQPENPENPEVLSDGKILIAYFSRTNNTQLMASAIHGITGGDTHRIELVTPYPESYNEVLEQSRNEQGSGYQPPLKDAPESVAEYDIIFIGYPIWHGTTPPPIASFLSAYNLEGKTIIPFCTSGGSGGTTSFRSVQTLSTGATVLDGLQIPTASAGNSQTVIRNWLQRIGVLK